MKTYILFIISALVVSFLSFGSIAHAEHENDSVILENAFSQQYTTARTTNQNINAILKIKAYLYSETEDFYFDYGHGSAVYIGGNKILTNAHVVLNEDNDILWNYEVCQTTDFTQAPQCLSAAKLLYINIDKDLAVLELNTSIAWMKGVIFSDNQMGIWDAVELLWYPANGNDTITLTTGKISGYTEWFFKTDANIDSGNSGWWAFNDKNEFVWIPSAGVVWLTTTGLIIPLTDVKDFIERDGDIIYAGDDIDPRFIDFINNKRTVMNGNSLVTNYVNSTSFSNYGFAISDYKQLSKQWLSYYRLTSNDKKTNIIIKNVNIYGKDFDMLTAMHNSSKHFIKNTVDEKIIVKKITLKWMPLYVYIHIDKKTKDIYLNLTQEWIVYSIVGNLWSTKSINDALNLFVTGMNFSTPERKNLSDYSEMNIAFDLWSINWMYNTLSNGDDYTLTNNLIFLKWDDTMEPVFFSWNEYIEDEQWESDREFLANPYTEYNKLVMNSVSDDDEYSVESWLVKNQNGAYFLVIIYAYEDEKYVEIIQYNKHGKRFFRYFLEGIIYPENLSWIEAMRKMLEGISTTNDSYIWEEDKELLVDISTILK